jgi:signal transduction histidine kinase
MDLHSEHLFQRRWVRVGLYLGFWTVLGLINVGQSYLHSLMEPSRTFAFDLALLLGLVDWYAWAALTPFIWYLARRWPLDLRHWPVSVPLHLLVNLLCTFVIVLLIVPVAQLYPQSPGEEPRPFLVMLRMYFVFYLVWYLWIYWAILGVCHALRYYRQYRERELQTSQLETRLAQARLQVLRMQLQPHFLFNTLHAISSLMHQDVEVADRMLARLGELLRTTIEHAGTQEIPLYQELEFIQPYLEIEKARLGERLTVKLDIDPEAVDAFVPNLILQPLVENAIRHGIAPFAVAGRLEIKACREQDRLRLEVRDNGPGLSPEQQNNLKAGVGVANTRDRLQQLYGAAHRFAMATSPDGGLVLTMILPFRAAENGHVENGEFALTTLQGV